MIPLPLRLKLIKIVIAIAFAAGFLLSPMLWQNTGRVLPVLPVLDIIPVLPSPADILLLLLFMVSLIVWIWMPKKIIGLTAVLSMLVIMAQDQMRWQPWVYIYLLMLAAFLFTSGKTEGTVTLRHLQLIISGVYIWSGLHKLNVNFIEGPFAQMVIDSGIHTDFSEMRKSGYLIPLIEIGMAVALLIPKFRKAGIIAAIGMHLFILIYLSQWATIPNSVVYPWNIAMIVLVVLSFWNVKERAVPAIAEIKALPWSFVPVALVWILPLGNHWGYWDHYPSFSFYSNKPSQYFIAIKDTQLSKTDKRLNPYFSKMPGLEGGQVLDMNHWALSELNVPFYPELRVFQKMSRKFNSLYKGDNSILYLELVFINGQQQFNTYTYEQLQAK